MADIALWRRVKKTTKNVSKAQKNKIIPEIVCRLWGTDTQYHIQTYDEIGPVCDLALYLPIHLVNNETSVT